MSGEVLRPPSAIPWYPAKLAWQLDANRTQLRKIAALGRLHDFMKRENDAGGITRQEAVSMIPPLVLDVQPHHLVCRRTLTTPTVNRMPILAPTTAGAPEGLRWYVPWRRVL